MRMTNYTSGFQYRHYHHHHHHRNVTIACLGTARFNVYACLLTFLCAIEASAPLVVDICQHLVILQYKKEKENNTLRSQSSWRIAFLLQHPYYRTRWWNSLWNSIHKHVHNQMMIDVLSWGSFRLSHGFKRFQTQRQEAMLRVRLEYRWEERGSGMLVDVYSTLSFSQSAVATFPYLYSSWLILSSAAMTVRYYRSRNMYIYLHEDSKTRFAVVPVHCTVQEGLSMVYVTNDDAENVEQSKHVLVLKTCIPYCEGENLMMIFLLYFFINQDMLKLLLYVLYSYMNIYLRMYVWRSLIALYNFIRMPGDLP